MSAAAVIALSALALLLGVAVAWLAYRYGARTDQVAEERVAHTKTQGDLERVRFAMQVVAEKLGDAERTIDVLIKEPDEKPNADLSPGDRDTRAVRAAIKAKAAAARRAGHPATGGEQAVSPQGATDASGTAEVLPAGSLDPDEPLL